jgi:signal transduction histidine kinase
MLSVLPPEAPARLATDESVALLAHELRDPLATIILALEVIPDHSDPAVRQVRAAAQHQARRAVRIVDDLFDLCAASWDRLTLNKERVDLVEVVAHATEATKHLLTARRHRLSVTLPAEPVVLVADAGRLEQMLTNLLANAAKFTDPGGHIRLSVERDGDQAVLRVRDNGRGISRDLLPRVFDVFWQHREPQRRASRGLGLGLALVRSLVEAHGGTVSALSDGPGTGAEFIVRLPACSGEA